jgi:ribosomal protein S18 acetylase RimI-like enzyme
MVEETGMKIFFNSPWTITKADEKDTPILRDVLVKAFQEDSFTNWLVKQDSKRMKRFEAMFDCTLKAFGYKFGHVYTNKDRSGAAVWIPPGKFQPDSFSNIFLLPAWLKVVGVERILKIMKGTSLITDHHPGPQYFYLMSLGTLPAMQGKGVGSALLQPVLEICDRDKIPACLETSEEKNVVFYKKHGFIVKNELIIPDGGPKIWIMTREPKI